MALAALDEAGVVAKLRRQRGEIVETERQHVAVAPAVLRKRDQSVRARADELAVLRLAAEDAEREPPGPARVAEAGSRRVFVIVRIGRLYTSAPLELARPGPRVARGRVLEARGPVLFEHEPEEGLEDVLLPPQEPQRRRRADRAAEDHP